MLLRVFESKILNKLTVEKYVQEILYASNYAAYVKNIRTFV